MKIRLLIALMLLISSGSSLSAQVFDTQTTWFYCVPVFVNPPEVCKVLKLENMEVVNDTIYCEILDIDVITMKQFGKEVWISGDKKYDYSLKVGDSFLLDKTYTINIDGVENQHVFGKDRIVQYAHHGSPNDGLVFVEGIGASSFETGQKLEELSYVINPDLLFILADPTPQLKFMKVGSEVFASGNDSNCEMCAQVVSNKNISLAGLSLTVIASTDILQVSGLSGPSSIQIFNASGQLQSTTPSKSQTEEISISGLGTGVYFVKVLKLDTKETGTLKFMKI